MLSKVAYLLQASVSVVCHSLVIVHQLVCMAGYVVYNPIGSQCCVSVFICSSFIGSMQLATSKGLIAGDLQFIDDDGNIVNCATHKAVCCL